MKHVIKRGVLAAGTSALVLTAVTVPATGLAATKSKARSTHVSSVHSKAAASSKASSAPAAPRHVAPAAFTSHRTEEVGVVGHPYRAQTVSVSSAMLQRSVPGTNPMKVLGQLPGVMFQSGDPQGLDTYSAQIMMHGFQQQEIGMTLDGMPLGEMTYRNYNGTNPLQAISSENVASMDVSRSAGAETVAATNNLGGSIEYISSDPKDKMGGQINQMFGSNSTFHTFIRFDSGKLNSSGTKFYVSYMRNDNQMWKGSGEQFLQQVNAKFVQPIGERSKISAFFDWSDLHQDVYNDYSFDMLNKLGGSSQANYYNGKLSGYETAYNAALAAQNKGGSYPTGIAGLTDPADAAYYSGGQNSVDVLGGLKADLQLTDHVKWTTTVYGHDQQNQTTWVTPYYGSPNGSPMSDLVKEPEIRRFGILSAVHYNIKHNELAGGVWYENNHYNSPMNAYAEPALVNGVLSSPLVNDLNHFSNPFAQIFNQTYNTNTFTAFVNDTFHPVRNLDLHFGFKSVLSTTRVGNGYLNQDYYASTTNGVTTYPGPITSGVGMTVAKPFLPHIGIAYRFLPGHEIFIDISENVHTYAQSGYKLSTSPMAYTQSAYDAGHYRPETAWTYAIGYRFNNRLISASAYAYRTNFNNRLQQVSTGSIINPTASVANVGGVTMNGVDAGLTLRPIRGLELTNSISYNHAVYDQNVQNGVNSDGSPAMIAMKGQQVVNYPRLMYKARLSYTWHNATAWIDGSYMSARNFSYVGDVKAPGYWLANLGADYKMGNMGQYIHGADFVQNLVFSFTVANLTNAGYISTMGEGGNPLSISQGALSYNSFMIGAPRQYFGSVRAEF
ncbi:TonB-dependent receptor [Acetobacter sp. TBRC 12305]|uniref:TonB-dependent receptor n=1 Tax=Acetobacter garciniae TaxID=2817435 RepID=A0A939HL12_9PROT|nr:TonB-dependent receptor [Acetobacter garciniae]MBO1325457.1 TonB-dependent receptor [Acetobacter garciniae]MBX0345371.1 TonB-dependent receptor [Acetobacter garciniae]